MSNPKKGAIELLYAADTGGQLFRFDVVEDKSNNKVSIQGAKLADIQGAGVSGNRRFYTKPDISFVRLYGQTIGLIGIGSGYRAHPLNEDVNDRFYLFYDKKVINRDFESDVITEQSLVDITNQTEYVDPATGQTVERYTSLFDILSNKEKNNGWFLKLSQGEKVLSNSSTINYRLFFPTYSPNKSDSDVPVCSAIAGRNKLFALNVLDGRPVFFRETQPDGSLGEYERSMDLTTGGIAPPFSVYYPVGNSGQAGDAAAFVGLEKICGGNDCDFLDQITTLKWRELTGEEIDKIKTD